MRAPRKNFRGIPSIPYPPSLSTRPRLAAPGWGVAGFTLFNVAIGIGHFLVLFNAGAYLAMFPYVGGDLGIPLSHVTWTQTDYFVGMALALPFAGRLARRVGDAHLLTGAFLAVAVTSLVCVVSRDQSIFLVARVLQGFAGGLTIPVSQNLLIKHYAEDRRSVAVALWGIAGFTPFTLAPVTGGWIAETLGWHWWFILGTAIAFLIALTLGITLHGRSSRAERTSLDLVGFVLLAVFMGCLQTLLNRGHDDDWTASHLLWVLGITSLLSFVAFVIWELGEQDPLLELRLFARRTFAVGALGLFLGFLVFQGLFSLFLVRMQTAFGYSAFLAGTLFLPMLLAKPLSLVVHKLLRRFQARELAAINFLGFAASCAWVASYDRLASYDTLFWPQLLAGLFLGAFFSPLTVLLFSGLPSEQQTRAVELGNVLRVFGGSLGITLIATFWLRRGVAHQHELVQQLTAYNPVTDAALSALHSRGVVDGAWAVLAKHVERHAAMVSFNEMFWLAAWIFGALGLFVWLAGAAPPPGGDPVREEALEELAEQP